MRCKIYKFNLFSKNFISKCRHKNSNEKKCNNTAIKTTIALYLYSPFDTDPLSFFLSFFSIFISTIQLASSLTHENEINLMTNWSLFSSHKHNASERHAIEELGKLTANGPMMNFSYPPSRTCIYPSYFSHFAILILIAISIVTQLSHITKIVLMVIVTGN
jgi:hypothetical protein